MLHVIENPEVAQALRQDKVRNLQYLKDTYDVSNCRILTVVMLNVSHS